ncbi:MAG: purine-nucleoside phosphorylase [Elusimicrobiota bacterium]|jgi:purine-nucleoside phosphorylase
MEIKTYIGAVRRATDYVRTKIPSSPQVCVVLGSGLAKAVPAMDKTVVIPYSEIPGFPRTTVAGHEGKLVVGQIHGKCVAVMQGRFHYYEGHSMESIVLPLRMLEYMGLKTVVLTAAVGSMREEIKPGHFVAITDHINFMGRNPLRGFHEEEFGTMFPDLNDAYDSELRKQMLGICHKHKLPAHEGVYLAVGGPSYETPAEIRAFRSWGGDVVGMSVVPEAIVARQMGIKVAALTWISNMCSGMKGATLNHSEVLELGIKVSEGLRVVLHDIVKIA